MLYKQLCKDRSKRQLLSLSDSVHPEFIEDQ